jgi:catechol 2,3-dioxygenase-like lactoylglutathione lyase family enzyme
MGKRNDMSNGNKVIPVLRIFDVNKAKEFYIDWLGFKIDWEHRFEERFPLYMQISLDDIVLHLTEHFGDCSPGCKVFIETTELEKRHQQLVAKNYPYNNPGVEIAPWNAHTMELIDPFGNKLLFNESLDK